jgi:tetratricopeptide (TPR) repeat protein
MTCIRQVVNRLLVDSGIVPQENILPFPTEEIYRGREALQAPPLRAHAPSWAAEFQSSPQAPTEAAFQSATPGGIAQPGFTPAEFEHFQRMDRNGSARISNFVPNTASASHVYRSPIEMGYGINTHMMDMVNPHFPGYRRSRPDGRQRIADTKGKRRMTELDDENWEKQFAEIAEAEVRDLDARADAAMEAELDDMDRSVNSETNEWGDFESIWRGIQAETGVLRKILGDSPFDLDDLGSFDGLGPFDDFDSRFHEGYPDHQFGNYIFEEENPFSLENDPFQVGLKIMNEGGNLSLAALAFEAALQKDHQHVEAWSMLGNVQAQNEKETPAIRAFEQTLKLDPSNLSALMGLAISYTNEGHDSATYRTLERWLSVKYPEIISPVDVTPETNMGFSDRRQLHDKVTSLFIRAAQLSPRGNQMDPDVQVGLGVLFYGAEDHSKAVDCFEAALASTESGTSNRPDQAHLLWNRLGATLANSGRSEEAIAAYEKALMLKPNFVRARYNLGVSCINIGCFEEAAQHLLGALSMHGVVEKEGLERVKEVLGTNRDRGERSGISDLEVEKMVAMNQSTNLLETLRKVFGSMGRTDLAERVEVGMDVDSFRDEFEF